MFDLQSGQARKIEGIPPTGWGFYVRTLNGRALLLITDPDWTETTAYELDVASGSAKVAFTAKGWLYDVLQVK